jgi:hypothetical protein
VDQAVQSGQPLAKLRAAVDELLSTDAAVLGEGDTVLGLLAELARLERVAAASAVAFDQSPEWCDEGAYNSSSWVTIRARCPRRSARRRLRLGKATCDMSLVDGAWRRGEIGSQHVEVLAAARTPAVADAFARDEAELVGWARSLSFAEFERKVQYWRQTVTPDAAEDTATAQREQRSVHLSQSFQGMWFGDATLDPVSGEIVSGELRRLEDELFKADWADKKAELGREPAVIELCRTPAQRRADALVEMATRSRTAPSDGQRPVPLFTALVGYEALHGRICELASRTVVTPGSLVPWLDGAYVERVVFDGNGDLAEVGPRQRLFRGRLRRGIEVRDRQCAHPLCDVPVDRCQVDHIVPFEAGGETVAGNGRLLCGFHNRLRQRRPWLSWDTLMPVAGAAAESQLAASAPADDPSEADDLAKTDPVFTRDGGVEETCAEDCCASDRRTEDGDGNDG